MSDVDDEIQRVGEVVAKLRAENTSWREQYARLQGLHVALNSRACEAEATRDEAVAAFVAMRDRLCQEVRDVKDELVVAESDSAYWRDMAKRVEVVAEVPT